MVTKEQYFTAIDQHFASKEIIKQFHAQIEKSFKDFTIDPEEQIKYSRYLKLKHLLRSKNNIPTNVFSVRTTNILLLALNSDLSRENIPFLQKESTIEDLITAFNNRSLHKLRNAGKKTLKEISYFIETSVVD